MIRLLQAINGYYTFKEGIVDTSLMTLGTLMKLITDVDTNTFAETSKSGGNSVLSIIAYLGMFSVILGRAVLIYYKIRKERQELLDKELDYTIKKKEHSTIYSFFGHVDELSKIESTEGVIQGLEKITHKTNENHVALMEKQKKQKK